MITSVELYLFMSVFVTLGPSFKVTAECEVFNVVLSIVNVSCVSISSCDCAEAVEENRVQAEERGNKLKQLLVKTKKELADSRKQVGTCQIVLITSVCLMTPTERRPEILMSPPCLGSQGCQYDPTFLYLSFYSA